MSDARNWSEIMAALAGLDKRLERLEKIERPASAFSTFTPTYLGSGTAGVWTYSVQVGRYIRLGSIVFITIDLQAATRPTPPTGNAFIAGLPFTAVNVSNDLPSLAIGQFDGTLTGTQLGAVVVAGTTTLAFIEIPAGGGANNNLVATALTATCFTRLAGWYEV